MTNKPTTVFTAEQLDTLADAVAVCDIEQLAWQNRAACRGRPLSTFFPDLTGKGNGTNRTKETRWVVPRSICDSCDVWAECLAYWLVTTPAARDRAEAAGFVGRCNPAERDKVRQALRRLDRNR